MLRRYPYLYEVPLFFLFLFGVNQFLLPQMPGFIGIDPHPYWIGILLFGFRYGVPAGLMAGVVSAALYLYSAWTFLERYLFEDVSFYLLPSFFVLVGVLVGVGVRRYRETLDRLTRDKAELTRAEKALQDEIKILKEINIGLEKKIATRMTTLVTLYEGAKRLEAIQLEDLYPAILEFMTKTLDVGKSSLYLKEEGRFLLKKNIGWQDYEKRPSEIPMNEGIIGIAGASNKVTSIRDFLQDPSVSKPALLGDAMIAGPLRDGENGEVVGVLSIQEMPFLSFNSATLNLFAFLLQWASRSIGRANYIKQLKTQEIVDPEYHVYSKDYFLSRAVQELNRSKTYYLPLSLGLVQVEGTEKIPKAKKGPVMVALSRLMKNSCREMDVIARFDDPQTPFAVLLVTASRAQAEEIRRKILDNFKQMKMESVFMKMGISSFVPKTKNVESLIEEAKKDL